MADELDIDGMEDSAAVAHLKAAAARREERALKAEQELAEIRAQQRHAEVQAHLREMGAPEQVARLYPADASTSKDAVKAFLRDSVGIDPDVNSNWNRYEQRRDTAEAPPAPTDELVALEQKLITDNRRMLADNRHFAPTPKEMEEHENLVQRVRELHDQWDQDVRTRQMGPLVDPQGYGGLIDPPPWALRTPQAIRSR